MRDEIRDVMLESVETGGFERLRFVIKALAAVGETKAVLLNDLEEIRGLLPEAQENHVLDVMDLLVGRCADSYRIFAPE